MPRLPVPALSCLVLFACAEAGLDSAASSKPPCPPGFVEGVEGCAFDVDAAAAFIPRFDQGELVRVNAEPFTQVAGIQIERNVWVAPIPLAGIRPGDKGPRDAAELYATIDPDDADFELQADFPVGTFIVHEAVNREEGHAIQVKLGPGDAAHFDELGRDWWFGKVYDDGTHDEVACEPCTTCHQLERLGRSDGLWGLPASAH